MKSPPQPPRLELARARPGDAAGLSDLAYAAKASHGYSHSSCRRGGRISPSRRRSSTPISSGSPAGRASLRAGALPSRGGDVVAWNSSGSGRCGSARESAGSFSDICRPKPGTPAGSSWKSYPILWPPNFIAVAARRLRAMKFSRTGAGCPCCCCRFRRAGRPRLGPFRTPTPKRAGQTPRWKWHRRRAGECPPFLRARPTCFGARNRSSRSRPGFG